MNGMEHQCRINYTKRKNLQLFDQLKEPVFMNMDAVQNYVPIYTKFFDLTRDNFENVNLNHDLHVSRIIEKESENVFRVSLCNTTTSATVSDASVFCKIIPLVDTFKYLIGKTFCDDTIFTPPGLPSTPDADSSVLITNESINDANNSAYVDGMFTYFANLLQTHTNFVHGVSYYGSFVGVKRDVKVNIYDDLEYLHESSFFTKHKNVDFQVEDYSMFINEMDETGTVQNGKKPPISITSVAAGKEGGAKLDSDGKMTDIPYSDLFEPSDTSSPLPRNKVLLTLSDLTLTDMEVDDVAGKGDSIKCIQRDTDADTTSTSSSSTSSCSSRTSCTSSTAGDDDDAGSDTGSESSGEWSSESGSCGDEVVMATIPRFPVELVFMEKMEYTLDSLLTAEDELPDNELVSIFMQVIMSLLVYQRVFSFTHNDLHSSNIMITETKITFLYYQFEGVFYKVPTFGRIAKIIDFGRSIYKYKGVIMCSDSFKPGADAATQYNTEPYFNPDKPRIEPNFSFDLCRLACSVFDDLIEDMDDIPTAKSARLVNAWCKDDMDRNVLYKSNGDERYPSFKLYKMIARQVHKHTPEAQLRRPEFKKYMVKGKDVPAHLRPRVMVIDKFPVMQ